MYKLILPLIIFVSGFAIYKNIGENNIVKTTKLKEGKISMSKIEIYTTTVCPYCVRAKELLKKKDVKYTEYNVGSDPSKLKEMLEKSNGSKTVPQIFINGKHIGGCDELYNLENEGKLDSLLEK